MNKDFLAKRIIFLVIIGMALLLSSESNAGNLTLDPPKVSLEPDGKVSINWELCSNPVLFEYHIFIGCYDCDSGQGWRSANNSFVTPNPIPLWYKKINIWVTALDENNSPIESCEYPLVTIDNPMYQPQQQVEEPTDAPELLKAEIINGELCLEWVNKEKAIQGTLIKQSNCLDCENINTTLVSGGDVTSTCTDVMSQERPLYIWIMNWVESGSFTPISNLITIEDEVSDSSETNNTSEVLVDEEEIEWYMFLTLSVLLFLVLGVSIGGVIVYRKLKGRKGKKRSNEKEGRNLRKKV